MTSAGPQSMEQVDLWQKKCRNLGYYKNLPELDFLQSPSPQALPAPLGVREQSGGSPGDGISGQAARWQP